MRDLPLDRTLIVAPHPDDDSIAAGGLIQRVRSSGGVVQILLVTDGESNAWPQRWRERKWIITTADRARWGTMRRSEALAVCSGSGSRVGGVPRLSGSEDRVLAAKRRFAPAR
jgi:LmbE family N-acetylglucosaminyl deacetylase